ncbi:Inner membrane protein YrbG [Pseudobythopirellula maris]|uniref:Inner membrane protein YrbG n=1 Tax=Pseudobythopirellula maris TaxID=2527991 RepID=A0A5C5ZGN2_9BACT|nr:calcium/sodium antiporter [Pseudobythopirellula maris]TWT86569.1 Inner membrane protein YrbG [Pseudobythopirellula maris]
MDPLIYLWIALGMLGLIGGGELLVRGASNLALAAKMPPLVIGLTVVALGTSAPELAASIKACLAGASDLAVGNVVGSNLANLLLVLGASAIAAPLAVNIKLFRLDIPVMIGVATALYLMGRDGVLSAGEGMLMTFGLAGYLGWTVYEGRRESKRLSKEFEGLTPLPEGSPTSVKFLVTSVVMFLVGLVTLIVGADWLVFGCRELALAFGVSDLVVGLTVVAIGTSMPELVISVLACLRGKRDLAVGNVVGSNILNVLAVLGISSTVAPAGIVVDAPSLAFHVPLMIAVSAACMPIFLSGLSITRGEGVAMLLFYFAYIGFLVYQSVVTKTQPGVTELLWFLAPLALGLLAVLAVSRREKAMRLG